MVEFMVGLVVMLMLLAGLIQIGQLTHAHTRTMIAARAQAGQLAMAATVPAAETASLISDWVTNAPTNALATLVASLNPAGDFFMVKGEASESVDILPIIRRLVYAHPTLEVESEAWLVWAGGIY